MPNPDVEREITYMGGPWDGETRWEPKAFWPPQNQKVNDAGGSTGAWPDMWPDDEERYMPEVTNGCGVRMVWVAPGDDHAPALIPRPESIKDYSDAEDW
jgi:hypothetical protein